MPHLSKVFSEINKISLHNRIIILLTLILLLAIPATVRLSEKEQPQKETSPESFAATCTNADAQLTWPSTPGCLVSKTISWPSVRYIVKVFQPMGLDPDQDGFTNEEENYMGTDPDDACADNSSDDAWPVDVNNDGGVFGNDIAEVVGKFGTSSGSASFSPRYDLDADGGVFGTDIQKVVSYFGDSCGCGESRCPFLVTGAAANSFSLTGLSPDRIYKWKVCYPDCGSGSYRREGQRISTSTGRISFSWPGVEYEVAVYDNGCNAGFCSAPGTPKNVTGTSTTINNLYPNRTHTYAVCWPQCSGGTLIKQDQFISPSCSGGGATYSVRLTQNGGGPSSLVRPEVYNLSTNSYTFTGLPGSTAYDFYVYSPSGNHSRVYFKGDVTSSEGICSLTENQMRDAILGKINIRRSLHGLPALTVGPNINSAAKVRAEETTINFSHTRPDGRPPWSVLDDFGISYSFAGEILARNNVVDDNDSVQLAIDDWMANSGHRALILDPNFTRMGGGVEKHTDGFNYFVVLFIIP